MVVGGRLPPFFRLPPSPSMCLLESSSLSSSVYSAPFLFVVIVYPIACLFKIVKSALITYATIIRVLRDLMVIQKCRVVELREKKRRFCN